MRRTETEIKNTKTKMIKIVKLVIFIVMLILSYLLSDKVVDYVLTINAEMLKRILNIIIIVVLMAIYFKD